MAIKRTDILVGDYCYNTSNLIAHGAFSMVYKGKHRTNSDLKVAIKTIAKKNRSKSGSSLENEILVLKEINHENIIRLLDYKIINENLYLVLELCNLGDLSDYLHIKGTLSEDTIRIFLKQISNAIKILSAKNIIHRDLKPSNILLTSKYSNPTPDQITVKVADFGFAKFLKRHLTTATLCGSPAYMAPEVLLEYDYDIKADLWSIGTILFQCLAGKPPFPAKTVSALIKFYQKNIYLTPAIPIGTSEKLTDLLLNLLKRDAKHRIGHNEFFNHPFIRYENHDLPLIIQDNDSSNCYIESHSSLQSSYESLASQRFDIDSLKSLDSQSNDPSDWQKRVDDFVMANYKQCNSDNIDLDISSHTHTETDNNFSSSTSLSTHMITPKPIPVPTKKKASEKLRRVHFCVERDSFESDENWNCWKNNNKTSRDKENFSSLINQTTDKSNSTDSDTNSDNRFLADISQLSPPAQYFCTTPPNISIASQLLSRRQNSPKGNLCSGDLKKHFNFSEHLSDNYSDELIFPTLQNAPNLNIKENQRIDYDKKTIKLAFHDGFSDESSCEQLAFGSANYLFLCNNSNNVDLYNPLHLVNYNSCCLCKSKKLNMQGSLDTSPLYFEGIDRFHAPELPEETLLDKNHNEIVAKLNYIANLVECIIKIAGHRGNTFNILTECNIKKFPTPSQRLAEKFVLYVRGLEFVSSALHFSRQNIMIGRLKISSTVRQVLRIMKIFFHECLEKCKLLGMNKLIAKNKAELEQINVDKIMYDYAINMCQSAVLEESFGNLEICFHRYKTAQLLLHCLSQQLENYNDKIIVMKYKEVVEKRLLILRERGFALKNL